MGARLSQDRSPTPHDCQVGPCRFPVSHVDGNIKTIARGHLEVDDRALIFFYPQNGSTLRLEWPFSVIRNYGRTTDFLFMIEVGRKSSTGDGFFFFKCRQASGVNDCLERHLQQYQELVVHRWKCRPLRQIRRRSRDKEPSASSSSFGSDFAGSGSDASSSYATSSATASRPNSDALPPGPPLSGGYVVPVFQRQDSTGDVERTEAHDYVNQAPPSTLGASSYMNVQPARLQRPSVEYSTVIADVPSEQVLGNDYANLPSLDSLPPISAMESDRHYYAEL